MIVMDDRRRYASKLKQKLVPKVKNVLNKLSRSIAPWELHRSNDGEVEVESSGGRYIVHIHNRTCDCREWQVTGIPCVHATVAIVQLGIDLESMVDEVYTTEMYKKCYDLAISPIAEYKFWEKSNENINVYPLVFKK